VVTVRYFAGARAAVGVDTETREACSFLVDGTSTRDRASVLAPGAVVDVLPPFAGG
jgi:molybdopterin synthase sulfur carrier subunit